LPYPGEHSCRIADPSKFREDSFRRITSGKLAIIIAKKPGEETTTTQAFRYPIDDWTEAEARAHCEKEGGVFEPAEGHKREGMFRFCYHADVEAFEASGKKYAKIFLIDDTRNRAGWGVTPEATRKALASLRNLSLLGPPESAHEAGSREVGHLDHSTIDPETGVAYGIFEVTEDAYQKIKNREWRHVSPMIWAHEIHFLPGKELITNYVFDHLAFCRYPAYSRGSDGVIWTCEGPSCLEENFPKYHFAAAFEAALESYKKACNDVASSLPKGTQDAEKNTIRDFKEGDSMQSKSTATPYYAADAWDTDDAPDKFFAYVPPEAKGPNGKKSLRKLPLASIQKRDLDPAIIRDAISRLPQTEGLPSDKSEIISKICSAAKQFDIESELCKERVGCSLEGTDLDEKDKMRLADLEAQNKELKEKIEKFEAETPVKALQAEVKTLGEEKKALEKRVADMETEKHLNLVGEIVSLKIEKGLIEEKDRGAEINRLKDLPDSALAVVRQDTENIVVKLEASKVELGPRFKYSAEESRNREEQVRLQLFGYTRDKDGKIVGGL